MEKELINYLDSRKANHLGGLRYAYWKRLFKYKIKERDYIIRKIFKKLLQQNIFTKTDPHIYRYKIDYRDRGIIYFD